MCVLSRLMQDFDFFTAAALLSEATAGGAHSPAGAARPLVLIFLLVLMCSGDFSTWQAVEAVRGWYRSDWLLFLRFRHIHLGRPHISRGDTAADRYY